MALQYNGKYEIYWHKTQDKETPWEPTSPTTNIATNPQNQGHILKRSALVGTGLVVAKRSIDTFRSEIEASTGNEILQTNINNGMKLLGYVSAVAIGGVKSGVMVGADIVLSGIVYNRKLHRQNLSASIERELQGKRVNIANGSAYYG